MGETSEPKRVERAIVAPTSARSPDLSVVNEWIGRAYLRLFGWRVEGHVPDVPKAVLIAAPHTSNWDLSHMLGGTWMMRVRVQWFGKKSIFRFPFGWFMRGLGGIAVDRSSRHNVVDQLAAVLRAADRMILAVPAAGTRSKREYWKSGFYHIAMGANVPIVLGYLDYANKLAGIGGPIYPTGNLSADMDAIRHFYATRNPLGKFPEKTSRIRLRAEDGLEGEGEGGPTELPPPTDDDQRQDQG